MRDGGGFDQRAQLRAACLQHDVQRGEGKRLRVALRGLELGEDVVEVEAHLALSVAPRRSVYKLRIGEICLGSP